MISFFRKHLSLILFCLLIGQIPPLCHSAEEVSADYILMLRFSEGDNAPVLTRTAARVLGQNVSFARITQTMKFDKKTFTVGYDVKLSKAVRMASGMDVITRVSSGVIEPEGWRGTYTLEQRGSKSKTYSAQVDHALHKLTFFSDGELTNSEPTVPLLTDINSLAFFWFGHPVKPQKVSLEVFDTKKLRHIELDGQEVHYKVGIEVVKAVKFKRSILDKKDANVEIVVRQEDGFPLAFEVDLSARYAVSGRFEIRKLPTLTYLN